MAHRTILVMHVEVRGELVGGYPAVAHEQVADRRDAGVEAVHVGVDLHPVARGDDEGLGHGFRLGHVAEQLAKRVTVHGSPFQDRHRRALVTEADYQHAHLSTA